MTTVIGLSGGIGSGKSTVAAMFAELGARVIDADAIVHELQAAGQPLLEEMVAAFGQEILQADGELNRKGLGDKVFGDPEARARLGALVHPRVGAEMAARLQAAKDAKTPLVILDIPLLFEGMRQGTGSAAAMGAQISICVWVPKATQIKRTMARDACTQEAAEARIAAQMPIDEKREMATHVIENSGTLEQTKKQVEQLYKQLTNKPENH